MPELPEVECVRRSLAMLEGAIVLSTTVWRSDYLSASSQREHRRPMLGATIDRVDRHGKELAILERGPRRLRIRLGMTGRLLVSTHADEPPPERMPHEHVRWTVRTTDHGTRVLRSVDPRRFGDLVVFGSRTAFQRDRDRLGPDALSIRTPDLRRRLAGTRRAIKIALLDQRVLAGVGNIYADEALFAAGIRPDTPACHLGPDTTAALAHNLRRLLKRAIAHGGTTIRDFKNGKGEPGRAQRHLAVYGRKDQPCRRCGTRLVGSSIGQRSTVWCPRCQQVAHTSNTLTREIEPDE